MPTVTVSTGHLACLAVLLPALASAAASVQDHVTEAARLTSCRQSAELLRDALREQNIDFEVADLESNPAQIPGPSGDTLDPTAPGWERLAGLVPGPQFGSFSVDGTPSGFTLTAQCLGPDGVVQLRGSEARRMEAVAEAERVAARE